MQRHLRTAIVTLILLAGIARQGAAQSTGIGTITPDASAQLDIQNNGKGLLIPRVHVTLYDSSTIPHPARGLMVMDTTEGVMKVNTGSATKPAWGTVSIDTIQTKWTLQGNTGTNATTNFLGTTDTAQLTIRVNNQPAARFDYGYNTTTPYNYPNIILGHSSNFVHTTASTVAGASSFASSTLGGYEDSVYANVSVIAGGTANRIGIANSGTLQDYSVIAGGTHNVVTGAWSSIVGGNSNTVSGLESVSGGGGNTASGGNTVAFGHFNKASGNQSVVMGLYSVAQGDVSVAMGGYDTATAYGAVAMGGGNRASGQNAVAFGSNNIASGNHSFTMGIRSVATGINAVAIGYMDTVTQNEGFAAGNTNRVAGQSAAAIGQNNKVNAGYGMAFGANNTIAANHNYSMALGNGAATTTNGQLAAAFANGYLLSGGNIAIGSNAATAKLDVQGTARIGTNGSLITAIMTANNLAPNTPVLVAAGAGASVTYTHSGLAAGDKVVVNPTAAMDDMVIAYAVAGADTITVRYRNMGTAAVSAPALNVVIIK